MRQIILGGNTTTHLSSCHSGTSGHTCLDMNLNMVTDQTYVPRESEAKSNSAVAPAGKSLSTYCCHPPPACPPSRLTQDASVYDTDYRLQQLILTGFAAAVQKLYTNEDKPQSVTILVQRE